LIMNCQSTLAINMKVECASEVIDANFLMWYVQYLIMRCHLFFCKCHSLLNITVAKLGKLNKLHSLSVINYRRHSYNRCKEI
jgi:hypothetical protein